MATILAHIEIQPGTEAKWEAIMADMVKQTFEQEEGVLRYEYFKGQKPLHYYCLLSFEDKWAFYVHQASDYHEGHDFASVIAGIELEYVDPVKGASDLPATEDPPLPEDASEVLRQTAAAFPINIAAWWAARA
jgi:quinol monooxygenase YgiN